MTEAAIEYINMGPWPVYVGFTTDEAAFAKEMERLKVEDVSFFQRPRAKATVHMLENDGTLTFILAMGPFKRVSREQYAALVAHEAMHIIQSIRDELSADLPLGAEAEAYLMQHIVQECLQIAWHSKFGKRTAPQ